MASKHDRLNLLNSIGLISASFALASCGLGGTVNQGNPTGTLVATGTLTGNGSATVSVYSQGNGTYAVQLAGLTYTGTCGAGSNVGVVAGSFTSGPPLTSTSGTTNYTFTNLSTTPTEVFIYCNGANPISSNIQATAQPLSPA